MLDQQTKGFGDGFDDLSVEKTYFNYHALKSALLLRAGLCLVKAVKAFLRSVPLGDPTDSLTIEAPL